MAIHFTLAQPLKRLPEPIAIVVDMFHDVKHMVFGGQDDLCSVTGNDHSVVGHIEDIAVDAWHLTPYVFGLAIVFALVFAAFVYLPPLARGGRSSNTGNPVPNGPVVVPSQTPTLTATVTPTVTNTPAPTSTSTPTLTPTPSFILPPIEPGILRTGSSGVNDGKPCIPVSKADLIEKFVPALHLDPSHGWATHGIRDPNCWYVYPWPWPKQGDVMGYWISADRIQIVKFYDTDGDMIARFGPFSVMP